MIFTFENREIEISVYGDFDDVQVSEAFYTDTKEDVPDYIIDLLLDENAGNVYEYLYEKQVMNAETYFEGDR